MDKLDKRLDEAYNNITWGRALKYGALSIGFLIVLGIAANWLGVLGVAASAPSKIAIKTLETDNIIHNYEWFHDVNASYQSRLGQISTHTGWLKDSEGHEAVNLRIELGAMQQTCRDLVTKYNANSEKINRGVFKGWSLPESLNSLSCQEGI